MNYVRSDIGQCTKANECKRDSETVFSGSQRKKNYHRMMMMRNKIMKNIM